MNVDVIEWTAKLICAVRFSHSWAGMTQAVVAEIGAAEAGAIEDMRRTYSGNLSP
jgi:hypothetical protein